MEHGCISCRQNEIDCLVSDTQAKKTYVKKDGEYKSVPCKYFKEIRNQYRYETKNNPISKLISALFMKNTHERKTGNE